MNKNEDSNRVLSLQGAKVRIILIYPQEFSNIFSSTNHVLN